MKLQEILNNIPDKKSKENGAKGTTSYKFKEDLDSFFGDRFLDKNIIELGTHFGYSAYFLSFYFKNVYTIERWEDCATKAREVNKDRSNVHIIQGDLYEDNTWKDLINKEIDVAFIDADHSFQAVIIDTINIMDKFKDIIIIYDDFGHVNEVNAAVNKLITDNKIKLISTIGHPKGTDIF